MNKEIRVVNQEKHIVQVTTVDERWYVRETCDPITGLPILDYVPSASWISSFYPKGVQFWKWLAQHGWDEAEAIKRSAGDRGSKVHYAIRALLSGEEVKMESEFFNESLGRPEPLTLEEYECLMSFVRWCEEAHPEVIDFEYDVWNESERYAGMVDLKCRLSAAYLKKNKIDADPKTIWGIDNKTSQDIWPSMEIQLSAYKHGDPMIERIAILQLGFRKNKAKFKFTPVEDQFALFKSCRAIWAHETAGQVPLQRDYPLSLALPGVRKLAEE